MGNFEHKPNSGSIFVNKYKERDAQPDWTGTALIDGVQYRIAGWDNEMRDGNTYHALKFEKQSDFDARVARTDGSRRAAEPTRTAGTDPGAARRAEAVARAREAHSRAGGAPPPRTMADQVDDLADDDLPF